VNELVKSFKEIKEYASNLGTDSQDRAKDLYDQLIKEGLSAPLIERLMEFFFEILSLQKFNDENKANQEDLEVLEKRIAKHKHLPNGDCVEAF
jgi:hypothetical protein